MREIISKLSVEQIMAKEKKEKAFYGDSCFAKNRFAYDTSYVSDDTNEDEVREMLLGVLHELLDLIFLHKLENKELFVNDLYGLRLSSEMVLDAVNECWVAGSITENVLHILESIKNYISSIDIRKFITDAFLSGKVEDSLSLVHRTKAMLQEQMCSEETSGEEIAINDLLRFYIKIADRFSEALTHDPLCLEHLHMFPRAAHELLILYSNLSENSILHVLSSVIIEEKLRPTSIDEQHKKINHILAILYILKALLHK